MPRGDKSAYTDKQKRKAEHIEEGYEDRGVSSKEAERRGWATVNKESGGGNKSGSGRGKRDTKTSSRKGGRLGRRGRARRRPPTRTESRPYAQGEPALAPVMRVLALGLELLEIRRDDGVHRVRRLDAQG